MQEDQFLDSTRSRLATLLGSVHEHDKRWQVHLIALRRDSTVVLTVVGLLSVGTGLGLGYQLGRRY